jgi:hypothetical protein
MLAKGARFKARFTGTSWKNKHLQYNGNSHIRLGARATGSTFKSTGGGRG